MVGGGLRLVGEGLYFLLAMVHVFEFDFSDFLVEQAVGFFDLSIFFLEESMLSGSFSQMIMVFGDFIGIELFFGLIDGDIVLFSNGQ
jgi:hypothetical protein